LASTLLLASALSCLTGGHILPLIWIAYKRVKTVELVQVIPLVLPRE
jgi:hypothetical protein